MKTIVSLIGVFFAVIIVGAIMGSGLSLLFVYATNLVIGVGSEGVSRDFALTLLCLWSGAATIASSLFIIVYSIRYPQNGIARIITYTVLTVVSWVVIIPLCVSFASRFSSSEVSKQKAPLISPNYFRQDEGVLYYYTFVNNLTETVKGVSFELSDISSSLDGSKVLDNAPIMKSDIEPFSDVLIYDTLPIIQYIDIVLPALNHTKEAALAALKDGPLSWLLFATWGVALYALIGIRRLFHWRLLNSWGVLLGYIGICFLNLCYFSGWDGNIFDFVTLPCWLLNCIIAAILSCIGIILAIFRPDPNVEHIE